MTDYGMDIVLPGNGTRIAGCPLAVAGDPFISDGVLLRHDFTGLTSAPANGDYFSNEASAAALELILEANPSSIVTANDLRSRFFSSNMSGSTGKIELTPAGCPHLLVSQSAVVANTSAFWQPSDAVEQYILDKATDQWLFILEGRITRPAVTTGLGDNVTPPLFSIHNSSTLVSNHLAYLNAKGWYPNGAARKYAEIDAATNVNGEFFAAIVVDGFTGAVPANIGNLFSFIGVGSVPSYTGSSWYNKSQSAIFRRFTAQRMTGLSEGYAARIELAKALWTEDVAGKWAGDTAPTSPAGFP